MAESNDSPKKTRKVRNPETFRERVIKAGEQDQQPDRRRRLRKAAARPVRPVVRSLKRFGKLKPVRILTWPFRLIGKLLAPKYVRDSYKELKLVEWPNRKKSRELTFAVIVFAIVFAVIVSIIDYGLDKLFKEVLLK